MGEPEQHRVSIILADDQGVIRRGLRLLLDAEPDFDVVAEVADPDSAARRCAGLKPDVLVIDLKPRKRALAIIPAIQRDSPHTAIVVLSSNDDIGFVRTTLEAGIHGFVLKRASEEELLRAIRLAGGGEKYLQPSLGAQLVSEGRSDNGFKDLSRREIEVLHLIALGYTSSEIAEQLTLSVRTIDSHRAHIHEKLGFEHRSDLVRYAIEHDLMGGSIEVG